MRFRTEIDPLPGRRGMIVHGRPLVLIGSCFSDNIGRRLCDDLFETFVNPFGPLYNPLSILRAMRIVAGEDMEPRFFNSDGLVCSFDAHSRLSAPSSEEFSSLFRKTVSCTREAMTSAQAVIVTFGTTRVFSLKSDDKVVANCHKQPGNIFSERKIGLDETVRAIGEIVEVIRKVNNDAEIIFTVSPLRYPGTDPHDNTVSKSVLHLAVSEVVGSYPGITYFPAYEIMMDDLRDYRFYADDMRHPSDKAVDYIYDKFSQSFFNESTIMLAGLAHRLTRRISHRTSVPCDMESWPEMTVIQSNPELTTALLRYLPHET